MALIAQCLRNPSDKVTIHDETIRKAFQFAAGEIERTPWIADIGLQFGRIESANAIKVLEHATGKPFVKGQRWTGQTVISRQLAAHWHLTNVTIDELGATYGDYLSAMRFMEICSFHSIEISLV